MALTCVYETLFEQYKIVLYHTRRTPLLRSSSAPVAHC
jgi:hypothetical protein